MKKLVLSFSILAFCAAMTQAQLTWWNRPVTKAKMPACNAHRVILLIDAENMADCARNDSTGTTRTVCVCNPETGEYASVSASDGAAETANALAADPSNCATAGQAARGIEADGTAECAYISKLNSSPTLNTNPVAKVTASGDNSTNGTASLGSGVFDEGWSATIYATANDSSSEARMFVTDGFNNSLIQLKPGEAQLSGTILRPAWQTVTTDDDAAGTSPAQTITVTSNAIKCACNDSDNCTETMSETLPANFSGMVRVTILSTGTGACVFADASGVQEMAGGTTVTLGANDVLEMLYTGSTWVEVSTSNN